MVCTINAGLKQGVFTLDCPKTAEDKEKETKFDFTLLNGLPARASIKYAGYGELSVMVVVNPVDPSDNLYRFIPAFPMISDSIRPGTLDYQGDAIASGWLERRDGKWLQTSDVGGNALRCRNYLKESLAAIQVDPEGYADSGKYIL